MGKPSNSGTVGKGEIAQGLVYAYCEIGQIDLEIEQMSNVRTESFVKSQLPPGLTGQLNDGMYHHIAVQNRSFAIGTGSGSWTTDFQNRYGLLFCPCCVLIGMGGMIGFVSYQSKQKKKPVPQKEILGE